MPNPKRERQKAYRRAKMARIEAAKRRRRYLKRGGIGVAVIIVALGLLYVFTRQTKPQHANTTSAACPAPNGSSSRRTNFTQAPKTCINPSETYQAVVKTDVGSFTITLDKTDPKVVNDFVFLARFHYYKGLTFHRVIPGFVVQGGDLNPPTKANPNPRGAQGPGYTVQGKAPKAGSYKIGTVAMAKTGSDPAGTAAAQFFVIVGKQGVSLPPDYAILGQVTSGMSVVNKIAKDGGTGQAGYPKVTHKMLSVTISSHK